MASVLLKRLCIALLVCQSAVLVSAQTMQLERVASGLSSPIFVTHAPGDPDRLFICQRSGAIRILDLQNGGTPTTFMTVPNVDTFFEGGLLGLAFHPDYQNNGHFYVNYTISANDSISSGSFRTRVSRFTRTTATSANPSSQQLVIEINQPQGNHNGGWIGFGADDFLYIATGDGGGANDTANNSQRTVNELLGKMLRLDVDGDDFPSALQNYAIPESNPFVDAAGDDEIFLYGLRNPFRCSFDRQTGDLYMGDVGQGAREEISFFPAAGNKLINMGWRLREGAIETPGSPGGPQPADGMNPIYDYGRSGAFGGNSVTGGVVYRGPLAGFQGRYFFGDFGSNGFWSFIYDGSDPATFDGDNVTELTRWNGNFTTDAGSLGSIVAFGEDLAGNVYIVDLGGEIFRIASGGFPAPAKLVSLVPVVGEIEAGSIGDLVDSDDNDLVFRGDFVKGESTSLAVEVQGTIPNTSPSQLTIELESSVATANLEQTIEVFNFVSGEFEEFESDDVELTDQTVTFDITESPGDYVSTIGRVRVQISVDPTGPIFGFPYSLSVDQLQIIYVD